MINLLKARSMESMRRMAKAICVVRLSNTMSLCGLLDSSYTKMTVFIPRATMLTAMIS